MPKRNKKIPEAGEDGSETPVPQQQASENESIPLPGRSGQGADSALARLIEQEQARGHEPTTD
jgi:hypothetical protein